MNQSGYISTSPCTIDTVRGKVEVDVFVESPDELVKKIICECKFWDTPVTKEKVHAFRTVVYDSGASLGLLISKTGFQSGAIEAAKYSNVKLMTWNEFTELIANRWILTQLREIKKKSAPLSIFTDPLDFPYEILKESDVARYNAACKNYIGLRGTCWMMNKTDLIGDSVSFRNGDTYYQITQFSSIESYINFLSHEVDAAMDEFNDILKTSNIEIPISKFENMDGYLYMFLN